MAVESQQARNVLRAGYVGRAALLHPPTTVLYDYDLGPILGTMGVPIGLLVLFIMGAGLTCDAGEVMTSSLSSGETMFSDVSVLQISHQEPEGEVKTSKVGGNENVCSMCIKFAGEAIEYFENNKTQTEIISILHKSCSRLTLLEQQVVSHGYWQLEFG
ncbi:hypothetical protein Acr_11g0000530 [Actinidia rufa]|uniref:Saposin-like type B region 1 domain-containing protein n=1 Tax=Actinidia rufa TaxID=165716 RepID=A0A7J0FCV8_9ERIC|nr:hypothetical protein Acr_11g0000530 [Actinidia rufa]